MSSPKLICKSGYIDNPLHVLHLLEYAGNKIAAQHIVYQDGSMREAKADEIIALSPGEQARVQGIRLTYKDGGGKTIPYDIYHWHTDETQEVMRVSELNGIADDDELLTGENGKKYHKLEDLDFFKYLTYIAERPGVEKEEEHGLFGILGSTAGNIPIEDARAMATQHQDSRAWTHIISLDKAAAQAAGFDERAAWKDLVIAKAPDIAKTYNISLENLVLNCAFHGNTDNPHAHVLCYSTNSREGFLKGGKPAMLRATEALKSTFFNAIFEGDVRAVEVQKHELRGQLRTTLDRSLENCLAKSAAPQLQEKLAALSCHLKELPGKKQYGYLPANVKTEVDNILRAFVEQDRDFGAMFKSFQAAQRELISGYVVNPETLERKLGAFRTEFFHPTAKSSLRIYHNAIVACAAQLSSAPPAARAVEGEITKDTPAAEMLSSSAYEYQDSDAPPEEPEWDEPEDSGTASASAVRAVEGKITKDTPAAEVLSSGAYEYQDSDAPPEEPAWDDPEFGEGFLASELRAVESKTRNFTPESVPKSTPYSAKPAEEGANAQGHSEQLFQQLIFAHKDIFKPLRDMVAQSIRERVGEKKLQDEIKQLSNLQDNDAGTLKLEAQTAKIFRLLYHDKMDTEIEQCIAEFAQCTEKVCLDANMRLELTERLRTAMYQGEKVCPHNYVINRAARQPESLILRQKSRFKPVYQVLFRALDDALAGTCTAVGEDKESPHSFLAETIRHELHALQNDGDSRHISAVLHLLYRTDKDMRAAVDNFKSAVYEDIKKLVGAKKAAASAEQLGEALLNGDKSIPVTFVIKQYANHLTESYMQAFLRADKALLKDCNECVMSLLRTSLAKPEMHTALRSLQKLLANPEAAECDKEKATADVFRLLCRLPPTEIEAHGEKAAHTVSGQQLVQLVDQKCIAFTAKAQKLCPDANLVLELTERIRTAMYGGEAACSFHFFINRAALDLQNEQAKYIFKEMAAEIKEYRSQLYRALCRFLAGGDVKKIWPKNLKPADMDAFFARLSTEAFVFSREKEKLMQRFRELWTAHGFRGDGADPEKLFSTWFYGTGGKYATLYMKEMVTETGQNASKILQRMAPDICGGLLHNLARMLHMQNVHAQNAAEHARRHTLAGTRTFKNRRFHGEQQFEQDDVLSY